MKKSILITGATSGIGQAATATFAANGYTVFATYRSERQRAGLAAIGNVQPVRVDVTDAADVEQAYATIADAVGDKGLYAVVNNAGITHSAPFELLDEERFRQVMDVNVVAPLRLTQTFLPLLLAHNQTSDTKSRVVNVASWAGLMAAPFIASYNASKYALIGLTESMYYDLRLLDIHVVLAIPGLTKTPLLATTTQDGAASLEAMAPEDRARYQHLFDRYAELGANAQNQRMLTTPEKAAARLRRIVDKPKPRFRYHLGTDAKIVDHVITHLPFRARAAMNTRMYQLDRIDSPAASHREPALTAGHS